MKLSPAAEYAVRGACVLAEQYGHNAEPVNLDNICGARDLPKQYLTKIFASLIRAGIIRPVRGKHGGYLLGRDPDDITLLEVIEAVEGPIHLNFCTHVPPECDREDCPFRPVWQDIEGYLRDKLGSVTLADVVRPAGK